MISSMTGFGRAVVNHGEERFVAEARSVNNRFTETRIYGLRDDFLLEFELNKLVKQMFHRGKFDLVLKKETAKPKHNRLDEKKLQAHLLHLQKIQKKLKLNAPISFETVLSTLPTEIEESHDSGELHAHFIKVSSLALNALKISRQKEGKTLLIDLKKRLSLIFNWFSGIEKALPEIREKRKQDVNAKIQAVIQDLPLDTKRIEAEIAMMIEKMDVTEELVRFTKHLKSLQDFLFDAKYSNQSVGRELDFTMQEMGREINTLGAKIGNVDISKVVVNIKSEMEKIREQVQNIE